MKKEEGNVIWLDPADSVGLCAQVPWIFNATLRKNIIMDAPFDDLRFLKYNVPEIVKTMSLSCPDLSSSSLSSLRDLHRYNGSKGRIL